MAVLVKICGINDEPALDAALEAGADMVGFVVFPASPRHVTLARGAALANRVAGRATRVALTVDADNAALDAIVSHLSPDLIQMHGMETPARVAAVKARFGLPVLRALQIGDAADLARATDFGDVADMLLFDASSPAGAKRPGGHGTVFDWALLRHLVIDVPWLLAGGLDVDNVTSALRCTGAPGVDVSSGVEVTRGVKDPGKIAAFVAAARLTQASTIPVHGAAIS